MTADENGPEQRLADNVYLFWLVLASPALLLALHALVGRGKVDYLARTGEVSGALLAAALMVTPLMLLFGPLPWLRLRRRHLGVASFLYAAVHLALWLGEANIGKLLRSFTNPELVPGWLAFATMALLAATSNDGSVRRLGPRWKRLQRWAYAAAILTLAHWLLTAGFALRIAVYCGPVLLLSAWRLLRRSGRLRGT
jgi:sulfoxide reductase heme-binding subunit YedZ